MSVTPKEIIDVLEGNFLYPDNVDIDEWTAKVQIELSDKIQAYGIAPPTVDCNTCINRGTTDGLSQETHCDHCIFSVSYLTNHYAPKPEVKP